MAGRVSLLIDSPLRDLALIMRALPSEVRAKIGTYTKADAQPIWTRELSRRAATRLQARSLVDSGRVGVTARNVFLRAGTVGRLSTGTPVALVSRAAEFGNNPERIVQTRSRGGKTYGRRMGSTFGPVNRRGNVFYPTAWESVSLFGSLWIQTTIRTTAESIEKA